MRTFPTFLKHIAMAALVATSARAGDYDDVLTTLKSNWPEKVTAGILCSVDGNQMALLDLTDAAKAQGFSVVVVNIERARDATRQLSVLLTRKPDFLILMDDDPIVGVHASTTRGILAQALAHGVFTVAITEAGLKCGALLAVGAETQGKVLVSQSVARKAKIEPPAGAVLK